jgi:hypothetical protein
MRRLLLVVVVGIAALALLAPAASARGTVTLPTEACVNLVEHLQGLENATEVLATHPGEGGENAVVLRCV